jgi:hypothetical protein
LRGELVSLTPVAWTTPQKIEECLNQLKGSKIMKKPASRALIVAFLLAVAIHSMGYKPKAEEAKITVLNPLGKPAPVPLIPSAPRLDRLDGKSIYLVDIGWGKPSGVMLLEQIKNWFARNIPNVKTVIKEKAGGYSEDDPALWAEVKQKGNAMIMAIGH